MKFTPSILCILLTLVGCDDVLAPEFMLNASPTSEMECESIQTSEGLFGDCRLTAIIEATGSGSAEWRGARILGSNGQVEEVAPSEVITRFGSPNIHAGESQSARFVFVADGGVPESVTLEIFYFIEGEQVESVEIVY